MVTVGGAPWYSTVQGIPMEVTIEDGSYYEGNIAKILLLLQLEGGCHDKYQVPAHG